MPKDVTVINGWGRGKSNIILTAKFGLDTSGQTNPVKPVIEDFVFF